VPLGLQMVSEVVTGSGTTMFGCFFFWFVFIFFLFAFFLGGGTL